MKVSSKINIGCGRGVHASTHQIHPNDHTLLFFITSPPLVKWYKTYLLLYALSGHVKKGGCCILFPTNLSYIYWDHIMRQSAEKTHIILPFSLHTWRLHGVINTTRAPSQRQTCGGVRGALTRVSSEVLHPWTLIDLPRLAFILQYKKHMLYHYPIFYLGCVSQNHGSTLLCIC